MEINAGNKDADKWAIIYDGHMRTSSWNRAMSAGEGIIRISELVGMKGGFMTVVVSIMVFRVS